MDNENKKTAKKVFKHIKTALSEARKYNKEKGLTTPERNYWTRRRQQVDLSVWDNTTWKDGKKIVNHYTIRFNNSEVGKCKTHYDVAEVFREIIRLLEEQKKAKGWGGLNYTIENAELESGTWSGYRVNIVPKVCLADAPCSEYKSLMNYINKFGVGRYGGKVNLRNYELFAAAKGGKRGYLWDEHGERMFLDNRPKASSRFLGELRKARGTKDIMTCIFGEEDYIDEEERRYSEYAEIECEGEHRKYLRVTIKTPTGRVKYDQKIF